MNKLTQERFDSLIRVLQAVEFYEKSRNEGVAVYKEYLKQEIKDANFAHYLRTGKFLD